MEGSMRNKVTVLTVFLVMFGVACGSMNRVLPSQVDTKAMEADVRGKILEVVPSKTFGVKIEVDNHAIVTLSGNAESQSDINKIVDAAKSVSGVKRVINNLTVK
jgi:osmotically-inducible protein OsmY